jgi:hypothetical protein
VNDPGREINLIETGFELWAHLVSTGAIKPESWDEALMERLRGALELDPALPMTDALERKAVDADTFVRAFFQAAEPYVRMWSDLLGLFEDSGADRGDDQIAIAYHFDDGKDPDVGFRFSHFRRARQLIVLVTSPFDLRGVTPDSLWEPINALPRRSAHHPSIDDWLRRYWSNDPWRDLPHQPSAVDDPAVQELLDEGWQLAQFVMDEVRAVSSSRPQIRALRDASQTAPGLSPAGLLAVAENDMWVGNLVNALYYASEAEDIGRYASAFNQAMEPFRNKDQELMSSQRRLEEFLDLPMWKQRYALFSNWVCCRVLEALNDRQPRVHASRDGTIRFRFSGTHLATFDAFDPPLHLFTELRSSLANPIGKGRKSAIQPDISLVHDPVTEIVDSPLAIECKQYLKPDNQSFGHAITDYARGRPAARIVLVDHGRVREEIVLQHVEEEVRGRSCVVGELSPDQADALARFAAEVRGALGLRDSMDERRTPEALSEAAGDVAALIELTWTRPPSDLDLYLEIQAPAGKHYRISYQDRGSTAQEPWCTLEEDIRDASCPERIVIARWLPGATYHVWVRRFDPEGAISVARAKVRIVSAGQEAVHEAPEGAEQEWFVGPVHNPIRDSADAGR